jgi:phosphate starvation-inducible membrane PsiE
LFPWKIKQTDARYNYNNQALSNLKGENAMEDIPERTQKYLGNKGLILFLALLSAFVPLSTDLYLPALPVMTSFFHVSEFEMNLTLILFFVFYSLATLVWSSKR